MHEDELGGRLELRDPAALEGEARRLYEGLQEGPLRRGREFGYRAELPDGRLIGPFNAMLLTPEVSLGMLEWGEAEVRTSSLDERMRQVVTLAVGAAWGSGYELYAHSTAARAAGFSAAAVEGLAAGEGSEEMDGREAAAYAFVLALSAARRVDDDLYAATKEKLGERVLAEVVMLAARYQVTCFLLNAYEVPVPEDGPAGPGDDRRGSRRRGGPSPRPGR
jgi:4-carboxymuconolactone decarboxylase